MCSLVPLRPFKMYYPGHTPASLQLIYCLDVFDQHEFLLGEATFAPNLCASLSYKSRTLYVILA